MEKGNRDREASLDAYEPLSIIGSGSFGKVLKIQRKSDRRIMVWKEMHYGAMSDKEKQLIVSEVNILREFRHPNIVRYHDRIIDREKRKIYIIMEYCEAGDLAQLIKSRKKSGAKIEEDQIWNYLLQICLALRECHTRKEGKVLHRDIKPANILLGAGQSVKLGDFGLARMLSENSRFATTNVGTPFYMSPEQIDEHPYDEKSDIWALGCVVYELCTLHPPFEALNQLSLAMKIRQHAHSPCAGYSAELMDIVDRCLVKDPSLRPSIETLLGLPAISLRLKERKIHDALSVLKKREEELKRREEELRKRTEEVAARERQVQEREKAGACGLCGHPEPCRPLYPQSPAFRGSPTAPHCPGLGHGALATPYRDRCADAAEGYSPMLPLDTHCSPPAPGPPRVAHHTPTALREGDGRPATNSPTETSPGHPEDDPSLSPPLCEASNATHVSQVLRFTEHPSAWDAGHDPAHEPAADAPPLLRPPLSCKATGPTGRSPYAPTQRRAKHASRIGTPTAASHTPPTDSLYKAFRVPR